MNVLNRLLVASLTAVPKPIIRHFAGRYIAGEEIQDAVRIVRNLNRGGMLATLDVLGEDIHERQEAIASRKKIIEVLAAISLPERVGAVMQSHRQGAQLRLHQQRSRPRREQSCLDDSWHIGVLSPFFLGLGKVPVKLFLVRIRFARFQDTSTR